MVALTSNLTFANCFGLEARSRMLTSMYVRVAVMDLFLKSTKPLASCRAVCLCNYYDKELGDCCCRLWTHCWSLMCPALSLHTRWPVLVHCGTTDILRRMDILIYDCLARRVAIQLYLRDSLWLWIIVGATCPKVGFCAVKRENRGIC